MFAEGTPHPRVVGASRREKRERPAKLSPESREGDFERAQQEKHLIGPDHLAVNNVGPSEAATSAARDFYSKTGVRFDTIPTSEQNWFLFFMEGATANEKTRAYNFIKEFKNWAMMLFPALEVDPTIISRALQLSQRLNRYDMQLVLNTFKVVFDLNFFGSYNLTHNFGVDPATTQQHGLVRAKDVVEAMYQRIMDHPGTNFKKIIDELQLNEIRRDPGDQALSGLFRKVVENLKNRPLGSVDLMELQTERVAVLNIIKEIGKMGVLTHALGLRGELKPIPEIHWRVDRTAAENEPRLGFNTVELLQRLKDPRKKKIMLEFGPGSGASRAERTASDLDEDYVDITMADAVYYPLNQLLQKLIRWDRLETAVGAKLSDEEKTRLSDALYKVFMIKEGETGLDQFHYAEDRIQAISRDPNNLKELLPQVAAHLNDVAVVPSTISGRDANGGVIYPNKVGLMAQDGCSPTFLLAKKKLSEGKEQYFRTRIDHENGSYSALDYYDEIPAFPAGVITGDFSQIEKLKNNQIDVALGVRSTVYKRGLDYENFMVSVFNKLSGEGIYIDDNVRDNDGWRSRIAELVAVKRHIHTHVSENKKEECHLDVIVGPGLSGEDDNKGEVPLAMVMSKNRNYQETITPLLLPGYRMLPLDEYMSELSTASPERLQELDPTGQLFNIVTPELSPATAVPRLGDSRLAV
ncbi:MAG: hypothetical protein EXS55_01185 [Candidatus Magasanikbacteria bacterium]|nr:hypothetical protein [Candidatus Magasanikbacteria bacterium]